MNEIPKAPDNTIVNLQEEYNKTDIQVIIDNLEADLIGLQPVKARIREIAALLLIDRLRKNLGMEAGNPGLHMSFTGSPGTGKTTVALKMADICTSLVIFEKATF
jgi:ATP-dependent Lon protease